MGAEDIENINLGGSDVEQDTVDEDLDTFV